MSGLTSVLHLSRDVGVVLGFGCSLGVWLYRREDDVDLASRTTKRPSNVFGAPMLALLSLGRLRRVLRLRRAAVRGSEVAGRGSEVAGRGSEVAGPGARNPTPG